MNLVFHSKHWNKKKKKKEKWFIKWCLIWKLFGSVELITSLLIGHDRNGRWFCWVIQLNLNYLYFLLINIISRKNFGSKKGSGKFSCCVRAQCNVLTRIHFSKNLQRTSCLLAIFTTPLCNNKNRSGVGFCSSRKRFLFSLFVIKFLDDFLLSFFFFYWEQDFIIKNKSTGNSFLTTWQKLQFHNILRWTEVYFDNQV